LADEFVVRLVATNPEPDHVLVVADAYGAVVAGDADGVDGFRRMNLLEVQTWGEQDFA
jgi:hypothetical protein